MSVHRLQDAHNMAFRILVFLVLLLGGCATYPGMKRLAASHREKPIKVLLTEIPMGIDRDRLQSVFSAGKKVSVAPEIDHAQSYALQAMTGMLSGQHHFDFVSAPRSENASIAALLKRHALSPDEAYAIRAATGADALLRFRITDYGLTPTSWRDGYIAFEIGSTLAIAGIIAYSGSAAAHAAAGGYLAQEAVEETSEAYAGFRGLDIVCRPVRIEAELVRLDPLGTIWETSETGLSDIRLSRLTKKATLEERKLQLDQSTNHAVRDISADLAKTLDQVAFGGRP